MIFNMERSLKTFRLMNAVKEIQTKSSKFRAPGVGSVGGLREAMEIIEMYGQVHLSN